MAYKNAILLVSGILLQSHLIPHEQKVQGVIIFEKYHYVED